MMGQTDSDRRLLELAVSDDRAALDVLLADHYDRLKGALTFEIGQKLGELYSADDCIQDTYAYVFDRICNFEYRGPDSFLNWLKQVARNKAIDAARAQASAKRGGQANRIRISDEQATRFANSVDAFKHDSHSPTRSLARRELPNVIRIALARLNDNERCVVLLRFFDDLDWPQVAERMDNTVSSVRSVCHRALDKLEETLGSMSKYLTRR